MDLIEKLDNEELEKLLITLKTDYKKCSCCGDFKSITDFHSKKSRTNKCKKCIKEKNRKYYLMRKSKS